MAVYLLDAHELDWSAECTFDRTTEKASSTAVHH
jgi:hypothetical protein